MCVCVCAMCYILSSVLIFRALKAGCKKPLLVWPVDDHFRRAIFVTVLGSLQALYVVCYLPLVYTLQKIIVAKTNSELKLILWQKRSLQLYIILHLCSCTVVCIRETNYGSRFQI